MQFEAKEPAGGDFSTSSQTGKDFVTANGRVAADCQCCRVNERDAGEFAQTTSTQNHDSGTKTGGIYSTKREWLTRLGNSECQCFKTCWLTLYFC